MRGYYTHGTCIHWNCNRGFDSSNSDCKNFKDHIHTKLQGLMYFVKSGGLETRGMNCPKCEKKSKSFGV